MGQAKRELEAVHSQVIDYANAAHQALATVQESGDADLISKAQDFFNDAQDLVREHTALINAYFAELNRYASIPGIGTAIQSLQSWTGLRGLTGGLGQWQFIAFSVAQTIGKLASVAYIVYLAKAIGDIAIAFKSHYEASIEGFKAYGRCLEIYASAVKEGRTPPDCGQPGGSGTPPGGTTFGLSTTAIIVGALALLFFLRR
jgi:hypothetical protein